jgi:hypothetical protein
MASLANNKAGAETQLSSGETAGLTSGRFIYARDFIEHVTWQHNRDPELWGTLTLTHSHFWRALSDRLVWEDADEHLALALQEASDRNTAGFDLIVLDPAALERLETEVTKVQFVAAGGDAFTAATLAFAKLGSAGQKGHNS